MSRNASRAGRGGRDANGYPCFSSFRTGLGVEQKKRVTIGVEVSPEPSRDRRKREARDDVKLTSPSARSLPRTVGCQTYPPFPRRAYIRTRRSILLQHPSIPSKACRRVSRVPSLALRSIFPSLLFADIPPPSLSSHRGYSMLVTIHQPSALLFSQFDRLLLLARGGRELDCHIFLFREPRLTRFRR